MAGDDNYTIFIFPCIILNFSPHTTAIITTTIKLLFHCLNHILLGMVCKTNINKKSQEKENLINDIFNIFTTLLVFIEFQGVPFIIATRYLQMGVIFSKSKDVFQK